MTRNGYHFPSPGQVFFPELRAMFGTGGRDRAWTPSAPPAAGAARRRRHRRHLHRLRDLAGIYFAVQASYEQQLVNANQQALTAACTGTAPPTPGSWAG